MSNKKWFKSAERKPEQGKKVLCFNEGDIDVRQRFGDYWFPIPYVDSKFADIDEPEMWQEIDFPDGFYGYLHVEIDEQLVKMDEFINKSEFFHFGILPQICIHSVIEDEYSKMYIPQMVCNCGCVEWIDGKMQMFEGFPEKDVHRCKKCNEVRIAHHIGIRENG